MQVVISINVWIYCKVPVTILYNIVIIQGILEALPGVLGNRGTGEQGHLFQGNRGTKAKF